MTPGPHIPTRDEVFNELDALIAAGLGEVPGVRARKIYALLQTPGVDPAPFIQCPQCQGSTQKRGLNRDGRQRFRCAACKYHFFIDPKPVSARDEKRVAIVHALIATGSSTRGICRRLGVDRATVRRLNRGLRRQACPCGKPGGHLGWCSFRAAKSPPRQAHLERLKAYQFRKKVA